MALGYLSNLRKKYDDPIAFYKTFAKEMDATYSEEEKINFHVKGNEELEINTDNQKHLGYLPFKKIYNELELNNFFKKYQKKLTVKYNLNNIFSLLIYSQLLFPGSKKKTIASKDKYFESFNFSLDDVYRSLNYFNAYSKDIQKHLHYKVKELYGRKDELGYYDVTNYYFEIPYNDEDELDEAGNIIKKGFRKRGPSKEHKPDPIIQMGLLMDSNSIPMAFNTFSGNESEKTSLLPTIKRVKADYKLDRVIVVADRGLNTSDNTFFLAGKNDDAHKLDGYIFKQTILGADAKFKEYVLQTNDKNNPYIITQKIDRYGKSYNIKYKSRIFGKTLTIIRDGKRKNKVTVYQKQVIVYSAKTAKKQKKDREKVLLKAQDLINNPTKYNKSTTDFGSAKYIKNLAFVRTTGEIADGLHLKLDLDKIKEEEKYDGYYAIVTSELHLSDNEIIDIYKGLWEIEESFKIIKSEFKARPVYLRLEDHINAHFLVCFVALIILRLLEIKLEKKFTVKKIKDSLFNFNCSYIDQNYYLVNFYNDCTKRICELFECDLGKKFITLAKIKKIFQNQ